MSYAKDVCKKLDLIYKYTRAYIYTHTMSHSTNATNKRFRENEASHYQQITYYITLKML